MLQCDFDGDGVIHKTADSVGVGPLVTHICNHISRDIIHESRVSNKAMFGVTCRIGTSLDE